MTTNIKTLTKKVLQFRDDRNWAQFHSPIQLALSLVLESSEVLEIFQWKNDNELQQLSKDPIAKQKLKEEMSDVLSYLLLLADATGIDLEESFSEKMIQNASKYPIEKAKSNPQKYTEL